MRRVCFIGNSHAGCIALAVDALNRDGGLDNVEIDIFASPQDSSLSCTISEGQIRPTRDFVTASFTRTSGGQDTILLDRYDDIFILLGESPYSLRRYVPPFEDPQLPPPSDALFKAIAGDWMIDRFTQFGREVARQAGARAVHFIGRPQVSEKAPPSAKFRKFILGDEAEKDARLAMLARVRNAISQSVEALSSEYASICTYPDSCLDEISVFTRDTFRRGAKRLLAPDESQPANDYWHMNADYGVALLGHLGLTR